MILLCCIASHEVHLGYTNTLAHQKLTAQIVALREGISVLKQHLRDYDRQIEGAYQPIQQVTGVTGTVARTESASYSTAGGRLERAEAEIDRLKILLAREREAHEAVLADLQRRGVPDIMPLFDAVEVLEGPAVPYEPEKLPPPGELEDVEVLPPPAAFANQLLPS
jgi:hypothetical protein